ncbi:MAG TPA: hypothetical protein VMT99_00895 [Candidatus Paceibacterota bacterium]|nr:hypothetical protein [Candidatus Paceibacterota bacterium]
MTVMEQQKDKLIATDLTNQGIFEPTFVIQLPETHGMHSWDDLERLPGSTTDDQLRGLLWHACHLSRLVHWGIVSYEQSEEGSGYEMVSSHCGGLLALSDNGWSQARFACEGCGYKALMPDVLSAALPSLLFHLLIKQALPGLRIANQLTTENLGTVAVACDKARIHSGDECPRQGHLGITLIPGVRTTEPHPKLAQWIEFLVQAKFDQLLGDIESKLLPTFAGPRHKGSLSNRRAHPGYW